MSVDAYEDEFYEDDFDMGSIANTLSNDGSRHSLSIHKKSTHSFNSLGGSDSLKSIKSKKLISHTSLDKNVSKSNSIHSANIDHSISKNKSNVTATISNNNNNNNNDNNNLSADTSKRSSTNLKSMENIDNDNTHEKNHNSDQMFDNSRTTTELSYHSMNDSIKTDDNITDLQSQHQTNSSKLSKRSSAASINSQQNQLRSMRSAEQMERLARSAQGLSDFDELESTTLDTKKVRDAAEYEDIISRLKRKNDVMRGKLKEFSQLLDAQINARARETKKVRQRMQQASYQPSASNPATMRDKKIRTLHKKIRIYKLENARLQKQIDESLSTDHVIDLENELRLVTSNLREAEEQIKVLELDRKRMMSEFEAINEAQQSYPLQIKNLRDEVVAYKKKMRELAIKRERDEKASRQKQEYMVKLEERVRHLQQQRRKNGSLSRASQREEKLLKEKNSEVELLRRKLNDLTQKNDNEQKKQKKQLENSKKKNKQLQQAYDELKENYEQSKKEIEKLKKLNQESEKKIVEVIMESKSNHSIASTKNIIETQSSNANIDEIPDEIIDVQTSEEVSVPKEKSLNNLQETNIQKSASDLSFNEDYEDDFDDI